MNLAQVPRLSLLFLLAGAAWAGTDPGTGTRLDRQANRFEMSAQDGVVLGVDPDGRTLAVWQSRRQQEGTYGIYARRFEADGTPLSGEVEINTTTRSHQMYPTAALDAHGTAWIAWTSFGQDGDQGTIVARRFDAALETATPEIVVNADAAGDQRELALASDELGRAIVVWTSPAGDSERRHVFGRRLDAQGEAAGEVFRVDQRDDRTDRLPSVAVSGDGGFVVAWARCDEAGDPLGIFGRRFDAEGKSLGDEFRISPEDRAPGIEPAVDVVDGNELVATWLEGRGGDYEIAFRRFACDEDGKLRGGEVGTVPFGKSGYVSGLAIDARSDGEFALAWNHFAAAGRQESDVMVHRFDADDRPLGEAFRATDASEGHQRISQADGTRKLYYGDDGVLAVAWSGNGGRDDSKAAHVSWIAPEGVRLAAADLPVEPVRTFDGDGATPHQPPTFDPNFKHVPTPEDATLFPSGDFGFTGVTYSGWTPPDPHMAAGPNHVVLMTNGAIVFYQKDGTKDFEDEIEGSSGFWGAQGAGGFVFDPEVVYDSHTDRFFAMACERTGGQGYFLLAVSDDSNPNGTWYKYRINVTAAAGSGDIDSPNIAVDSQAVYLTADFFSPTDKLLVYVVDKAPLLTGGAISAKSTLINGKQSHGIAMTYGTAPAQYMTWANEYTTSTTIQIVAIQNPLTGPTIVTTNLTVPQYSHPEDPPQLGTSVRPQTFEARFWSCVYRNGYIWATHHIGSSRIRQRWYQIDPGNWPNSGSVSLVQSGEVDLGGTIRTFFGSIWADDQDNMALTYARSSPTEYISMGYTYRTASDPPGTTRTPVTVQTSTSPDGSGRWGDYSAIVTDPATPGRFWAHHEYRTSSWRTWVHRFDTCDDPVNYCIGAPNSVGSGESISFTGTPSISGNNFTLTSTGGIPSQFGLFYFGPNQIQIAFGDGYRCVGGGVYRLGPAQLNSALGDSQRWVDFTAAPSNIITVGSTWYFQHWYRDPGGPGGSGFNYSDGLEATFCP